MPGSVVDLVLCVAFVAISALIVFIITSGSLRRHRSTSRSKRAPSVALLTCPLFGHLSLLGRYPHRSLTQLSRRLGPVYSLQLGRRQAVVISGRAAVRAAFSTAGSAGRLLDDRPVFELYRHYAAGCSISFGRRGAGVRLHRRLARRIIRRLIASGLAETIVEREATSLVANWTDDCGRCLDPADDVTTAVSSALFSMCYGLDARIDEDPEYHQLLRSKGANSDMFAIGKQVCSFAANLFTPLSPLTRFKPRFSEVQQISLSAEGRGCLAESRGKFYVLGFYCGQCGSFKVFTVYLWFPAVLCRQPRFEPHKWKSVIRKSSCSLYLFLYRPIVVVCHLLMLFFVACSCV